MAVATRVRRRGGRRLTGAGVVSGTARAISPSCAATSRAESGRAAGSGASRRWSNAAASAAGPISPATTRPVCALRPVSRESSRMPSPWRSSVAAAAPAGACTSGPPSGRMATLPGRSSPCATPASCRGASASASSAQKSSARRAGQGTGGSGADARRTYVTRRAGAFASHHAGPAIAACGASPATLRQAASSARPDRLCAVAGATVPPSTRPFIA
jgi:hypothetical protein